MDNEKLNESLEELRGLGGSYLPVVAYLGAAVATVVAAGELAPVARVPKSMAIQTELLHQAERAILAACQEIDCIEGELSDETVAVRAAGAVQDLVDSFLISLVRPAQAPAGGGR